MEVRIETIDEMEVALPEKTRSLTAGHLDVSDIELAQGPPLDFFRGRGFEEQRQRFLEVLARLGNAIPPGRRHR